MKLGTEELYVIENLVINKQRLIGSGPVLTLGVYEDEVQISAVRAAAGELISIGKEFPGFNKSVVGNCKTVSFNIPIEHDDGGVFGYKITMKGYKGNGIPRPIISINVAHGLCWEE